MTWWWGIVPEMAAQAAIVAALVWIGVRMGARWPAPVRQSLLLIALLKFIMPPVVSAPFSLFTLAPSPDAVSAGTVVAERVGSHGAFTFMWLVALPLVHLLGVVLVGVAFLVAHTRLAGVRRRASPVEAGPLEERFSRVLDRLSLRRRPILLISGEVDGPLACGVRRPAVILPSSLADSLASAELDAVLAHEAGHHRRRDLHVAAVRAAICGLWWWHPLVWMTARALREAQEDACDDLVVAEGIVSGDRYCDALLRSAGALAAPTGAAAAFAARLHPLGRRVRRLLDAPGATRATTLSRRAAVGVAISGAVLLPNAPSGVRHDQTVAAVRPSVAASAPAASPADAGPVVPPAGVVPVIPPESVVPAFRRAASAPRALPRPSGTSRASFAAAPAGPPAGGEPSLDAISSALDSSLDTRTAAVDRSLDTLTVPFESLGSPLPTQQLEAPPLPDGTDRAIEPADSKPDLERAARDAERKVYRIVLRDAPEPVAREVAARVGNAIRGDEQKRPLRDAQRWFTRTVRLLFRGDLSSNPNP